MIASAPAPSGNCSNSSRSRSRCTHRRPVPGSITSNHRPTGRQITTKCVNSSAVTTTATAGNSRSDIAHRCSEGTTSCATGTPAPLINAWIASIDVPSTSVRHASRNTSTSAGTP